MPGHRDFLHVAAGITRSMPFGKKKNLLVPLTNPHRPTLLARIAIAGCITNRNFLGGTTIVVTQSRLLIFIHNSAAQARKQG